MLTICQKNSNPIGAKNKHFSAIQESTMKDIDCAFGVLQACFAIMHQPARMLKVSVLKDIMKACIIIHSMIVEDEQNVQEMDFNYEKIDGNPIAPIYAIKMICLRSSFMDIFALKIEKLIHHSSQTLLSNYGYYYKENHRKLGNLNVFLVLLCLQTHVSQYVFILKV